MLVLALLSVPPVLADVPDAIPVEVESHRAHRPPPPPPPPRRPPPPPPPRPAPPADPVHEVSLTLSATDLAFGLLTGNLEARLAPEVSLVGTLGLGSDGQQGRYRLGGELRGYVVGDFDRGLFLGAGVEATNVGWFDLDGGATGLSGFGGAKLTLPVGLTLEGKLGVEGLGDGRFGYLQPVAAVNLGWSF